MPRACRVSWESKAARPANAKANAPNDIAYRMEPAIGAPETASPTVNSSAVAAMVAVATISAASGGW